MNAGGWALLLAAGLAGAQPMPMEYVGDLGHLGAGETLRIGAAEARANGNGRVRVTGKGWVVDLEAAGGRGGVKFSRRILMGTGSAIS